MKRIITGLTFFVLLTSIPNMVLAHSHIGGSNPADEEVVEETLEEIVLTFDGGIEQGSTLSVTTEGQEVELADVAVEENTLTASVATPFPNGEYQVDWNIISADGHPMEGNFSFTVNVPESEANEEATESEEQVEEATETSEDEETASSDQSTEEQDTNTSDSETTEDSSNLSFIIIGLAVIILVGLIIFFIKKRK